jgi:ABC-type polysaccharide/polyol phosphate transport system ATPase subunit
VTEPAIQLSGVGKRYRKLEERATLLRSMIPFRRPKASDFWALADIDLAVQPGETVGVIGRNGAGKTSLLRLLAGVSTPTTGDVVVRGRIAPLISVGVGFHREMTGRENVFVNGMLLGLAEREVAERFDDIVAFAELGDFVDVPVKFYSSGMFMRLGFAVAVHTDPEVLLVDEVLAVGDSAFQMKCLQRMRHLQAEGTTIILVSHSMHAIRLLCPRTLLVRRGRLEFDGETEAAVARHHELLSIDAAADSAAATGRRDAHEPRVGGGAQIVEAVLLGADGPAHYIAPDDKVRLRVRVRFDREVDNPQFVFTLVGEEGAEAYGLQSPISLAHRSYGPGDVAEAVLAFEPRLGGGTYRVTTTVATSDGRDVLVTDPGGVVFYVEPRAWAWGVADLNGVVTVDGTDLVEDRPFRLGSD